MWFLICMIIVFLIVIGLIAYSGMPKYSTGKSCSNPQCNGSCGDPECPHMKRHQLCDMCGQSVQHCTCYSQTTCSFC
jgi:hypothetical protein